MLESHGSHVGNDRMIYYGLLTPVDRHVE